MHTQWYLVRGLAVRACVKLKTPVSLYLWVVCSVYSGRLPVGKQGAVYLILDMLCVMLHARRVSVLVLSSHASLPVVIPTVEWNHAKRGMTSAREQMLRRHPLRSQYTPSTNYRNLFFSRRRGNNLPNTLLLCSLQQTEKNLTLTVFTLKAQGSCYAIDDRPCMLCMLCMCAH